MLNLVSQIDEALASLRSRYVGQPKVGIILGSGLGGMADEIEQPTSFSYTDIPHFAASTAAGHRGRLVCGQLAGVEVVAMQGRLHSYEGYTQRQITFPVRVMRRWGVEVLIVSNASGGVNPYFQAGDVMVIDDHINLMFDNPLIGVNDDRLGPRFPDMSQPYCPQLIERALTIARRENFPLHRGVYLALKGPNFEPRAEYRFYRQIGADAVGMSTVPEVLVAVHGGMRILGLSVISNVCLPDAPVKATAEDVLQTVALAGDRTRKIVRGVLESMTNA